MTKEYALHLLNQLMIGASVDAKPIIPQYELAQALDLAIKALEQQPCDDCISRQAVIRLVEQYPNIIGNRCSGLISDIKHLPPVTPKYTDEEIDKMQEIKQAYVDKMIELAIEESRQKVKPSDSVNRAAVKLDMLKYGFSSPNITITEFVDSLPPVYPERSRGKWIGHGEHCENLGVMPSGLGAYEWCSNCDCGIDVREWHRNHYNFCPNCGADMRGENNGNMD